MALKNLSRDEMRSLLEEYVLPDQLRPRLEEEPRLEPFLADFEALLERFLQRDEAAKPDPNYVDRRAEARARRDLLVDRHDRVVRQAWHLVQIAKNSDDAKAASRWEKLLFPNSLEFYRRGAYARVAEARAVKPSRKQLQRLDEVTCAYGSLADLHRERVEVALELDQALVELRGIEAEAPGPVPSALPLRHEFIRLMHLFRETVRLLDLAPGDRAALLSHVEEAAGLPSPAPKAPTKKAKRRKKRRR
ncbi:MAG: hypothetical protein AAFU79_02000 [Myxococcota bacterium]